MKNQKESRQGRAHGEAFMMTEGKEIDSELMVYFGDYKVIAWERIESR